MPYLIVGYINVRLMSHNIKEMDRIENQVNLAMERETNNMSIDQVVYYTVHGESDDTLINPLTQFNVEQEGALEDIQRYSWLFLYINNIIIFF